MAYKRRRTSRKSKRSKKPFTVSLNSRRRKGVTTNSQVQKRLESLLQKRSKFGNSQQEGGFIGAILAATAPLWLPLAVKGVKRYFTEMMKEFVLIELQEYNRDDMFKNADASMLSIQQLLNAVKSRVGIMYHNKVDNLFEFLKTHPSVLSWTDFGEAIVDGIRLQGSNVYDMLDYLFHDWRKISKQSPPQGLDTLIRILFQNGFDPQNVMNRRLRVFCHANEPCKSTPLGKSKQKSIRRQGIKWSIY